MIWLYRLQQRLAITRNEGFAILILAGLLLLGLAVRHGRPPTPEHDASTYEGMEARFRAHVAKRSGANRAAPRDAEETTAARIDLNTASPAELQRLPGIGPSLSERIEAYRTAHGPFDRVEEITRVRGIGEKTLERIQPMLAVEDAP